MSNRISSNPGFRKIFSTNMDIECLTFQPLYFERIWGGRKLQAYFGRSLPDEVPIGESWELVDRADAGVVSFGNRIFRPGDLFLVPAASHMGLVTPRCRTPVVLRTTL
jgi:hypothetical protein